MAEISTEEFYNQYYDDIKDLFIDFKDDGYDISLISAKRLVPTKGDGSKYKIVRFSNITYKEINYIEVNISGFLNKRETYSFSKSNLYLSIIRNIQSQLKGIVLYLDIDSMTVHENSISNYIYRIEDIEKETFSNPVLEKLSNNVIINFKSFNKINEESGIRNINKLIKDHLASGGTNTFEIWMHIDLDGLTSCLAMKGYLERYGMKMVDSHKIQYGNMEFAIKNKRPTSMACVVDFAHFKSVFTIGTDHHEGQTGKVSGSSYATSSRSNVETISGKISFSDIFTPGDVELVRTVDSANFLTYNIKPEDVQNSIFKIDKEISGEKNRFMMGFVVNRLLLAYKNKRITVTSLDGKTKHVNKNILECMAIDCSPSLYSMFNTLKHYIKNARTTNDKQGFLATPQSLKENLYDYIERMKNYKFIETEDGNAEEYDPNWKHKNVTTPRTTGSYFDKDYKIIIQYGAGSMYSPGSYDRYVPFKNNPDAEFICMIWPMGLIQVSCNPFKEKKLDLHLGEIAKEVLALHKNKLSRILIPIDCIKKEYETSQDWKKMKKEEGESYEGIGFRFSDLVDFYGGCVQHDGDIIDISEDTEDNEEVKELMNKNYALLTDEEKLILSSYTISEWDIMAKGSGGHKSITNIQGFLFIKYNLRSFTTQYSTLKRYTDLMKVIGREIVNNLKQKIDISRKGDEVTYKKTDIVLSGQNINENFDYFLLKKGIQDKVSKEEFVKAGASDAMRPKTNGIVIDIDNKKIVASFENFKNRFDV